MQCVVILYPTVSSVKVKLYEVYGHFTVLDLCEAYGCFIATPCWYDLNNYQSKIVPFIMQFVVIGCPTVSSVKVKLCDVYGCFTVLDLCKAHGCFIALPCWF